MKKKKAIKILLTVVSFLSLLLFINFIPAFDLKTAGMNMLKGVWVNVYYENEKAAATDTFTLADERAGELAELLGVTAKPEINIYIYDNQATMQTKKYGFVAPLLDLDWYIGDNVGTNVILTSPANPGEVNDYENNKNAVLHEIIHAYNSVINRHMTHWIDNGLAGYLSGQTPQSDLLSYSTIPTLDQTHVGGLFAPIIFSDFGGYAYSYTYIEYLNDTFSWDSVKQFAADGDYIDSFGIDEKEVYNGWVTYLKNNYS